MKIIINLRRLATPALALAVTLVNLTIVQPTRADEFVSAKPMYSPRDLHTATLLTNGQVLVTGGLTQPHTLTNGAELYTPASGSWALIRSMNYLRGQHTASLLLDGRVLVAGGEGAASNTVNNVYSPLSAAEVYDPATGNWTPTTQTMKYPRVEHTSTVLPNGLVLVTGGYSSLGVTNTAELFNPANGSWTVINPMNVPRMYHTATLLPNGKMLVAGGTPDNTIDLSSAELYDPASGSWTLTHSMVSPHARHTATLLANGQVLVADGNGSELYDPASGNWTGTFSMKTGRWNQAATLLPNGDVLAAGGTTDFSSQLSSAELYNPTTKAWAYTTPLGTARELLTATLLPDENVLFAGGQVGNPFVTTPSAELYIPQTIVPSIAANNTTPFGSGSLDGANLREQDVYASSQFPTAPIFITEIRFQPDIYYGKAFAATIQNIQINMSTTVATPDALSSTFAANVGPNPVTVLTGPVSVSSAFTKAPNGTMNFDIVLHLTTPYLYDPTKGNLLVDIENVSGSTASQLGGVGVNGDGASRVSGSLTSSTGVPDTGANAMEIGYELAANATVVPSNAVYNATPFGSGTLSGSNLREQDVYASSQFLPFPMFITAITFQPDSYYGKAFSTTIQNIQIYMSTTAATPDALSATFAANVGPNPVNVLSGPVSVSSTFTGPAGGPKNFDIVLPLSTPFFYNPAAGNLLVDIQNTSGSTASPLAGVGVSGDGGSRVSGPLNSAAGTPDNGVNAMQVNYNWDFFLY